MTKIINVLCGFVLLVLAGCSGVDMSVDSVQESQTRAAVRPGFSVSSGVVEMEEIQSVANRMLSEISTMFKLPMVPVLREECGEDNAFYDLETKTITMCMEMVSSLRSYAQTQDEDVSVQNDITINSLMFFLLHELGHAYVDLLQFPVTGREEDVADQIASYLILELGKDNSFDWIADGAFTFYQFSEENPEIDDEALADVHSLDKQRFYNIACWLYGATADETIVTDWGLPEERAAGCEDEYNLMASSLDVLLGK